MTEDRLVRAMKGIALFISFVVMGISLPDMNAYTMLYITDLGFSIHVYSYLFIVSGIINLFIGLAGLKWNALFFTVWIMYSVAAFFGHINGSGTPAFAVAGYVLLSTFLILDCLADTGLLGNKLWNKRL